MALPVLHKRGDIVMMVAFDTPTTYVNFCGATSISLNLENAVSEVRVGDCEDWSLPTRVIASYGAQTVNATVNAQLARSNRDRLLRWAKDQIALPVRLHIVSAPSGEVEYIDGSGMLATLNVENIGSTDDGAVVTTTLNIRFEDGVEFINSGQVLTAPQFTAMPSLLGSTALGGTITVNLGAASGTPTPALTGTLTRPGASPIAVTQGQQVTIAPADQGGSLSLTAVATNSEGTDTETLARMVPAADPATAPTVTASPVITGSATAGGTLSSSVGTASGNPAPTGARQWLADGVAIAGANGASLDTTGRGGQSISLRVTWSNGTGSPAVATSNAIAIVAAATAPSPFAAGDWSLTTGLEASQLVVDISALPANGGSSITALQYSANNGTWTPLTGAGTGARTLTMAAPATSYAIRLRAVNTIGNSTPGDTKTATSGAEGVPALAATALWVGAVTNDTLMVSAYAEQGAATMQAFAVPVGGGAEITGPTVAVSTIEAVLPATLYPTANYAVARCTITGLSPDREYDIGVRIDGRVTPGMTGWAKTRPAVRKPFTFGFGTCFEMNTSRNYLNFDTMAAQDLDFFAVLDDRGYSDITVNDFRRYYRADWGYLHHPKIGPFHRAFPIYNVPGDHDFGADNSNAGSAGKPGFMQWYRNHAPQPVTLTGALDPVDYAVWIAPGLKLVMADTRTNRSGVMFMDAAQEARLIAHIQEVGAIPDAAMIWNSGTPWISTSADMDTWAGATAQRQRIADAVLQYAPGRVAIICGDMHALAFDDGTNSAGGMPVFHAAPMARANSSKGGPYSGGSPIVASQTQYGQMDCTPVTGGWQLSFRGYSVDTAGVQTVALTGAATLVAADPEAPVDTYASDFSEFSAGAITAPWQDRPSTAARPVSPRFVFATVGGAMALTAPGTTANDTSIDLRAVDPGESLQMFLEAETSYSGSSSLEWHIYSTTSELFYRFDLNPVGDVLRLRKFTGASNTFDTSGQVTVPQDILANVRVRILTEIVGGTIRAKVWNAAGAEPVGWQLVYTDPSPVPGPYIAGVGCAAGRPQPTIRQIGVAIDGAAAPRAVDTPPAPEWTPLVPTNGGPQGAAAAFFRGIVTPDGPNYRVTTAADSTNGRAAYPLPAAGTVVTMETSIAFGDATRIICRQVGNNDSTSGITVNDFDVNRPAPGAVLTRTDTFTVAGGVTLLHFIGVTAAGQFFTINAATRIRVGA